MIVKLELKELCKEFINILQDLNEKSIISDDELQLHLKQKVEFLKEEEEKLKV